MNMSARRPREGIDFFTHFIDLPYGIGGATRNNDDGTFTIFLNKNIPENKQFEAYEHEIRHIVEDHFSDLRQGIKSLEQIEAEADGIK